MRQKFFEDVFIYQVSPEVIAKTRNDLTFNTQKSAIYTVWIVVVVLWYLLVEQVSSINLACWALVCVLVYSARLYLAYRYLASDVTLQHSARWQKAFTVSVGVSGLVWGVAMFVIFPEKSVNHQMLLVILLVILTSATTVTHTANRWASVVFACAALIPAAIKLFWVDAAGYPSIGAFLLLFVSIIVTSSSYLYSVSNQMFILSHQNDDLLNELRATNDDLVNKNQQLNQIKDELSASNDSLKELATTDGLTGLSNRRKFEAHLQVKWQRCEQENKPLSLLLVDIDFFKQYNDFYGHQKGDRCLIEVGQALTQISGINRIGDCISRFAGEEFVVLLPDSNGEYASRMAETVRRDIEALRISRAEFPHEVSPWVTVSVGVACISQLSASDSEQLFRKADQALYHAKYKGKNQVFEYTDAFESPLGAESFGRLN